MKNLEELRKLHKEAGVIRSTLDWTPEEDLEAVASEMLRIHKWLQDPVNKLTSLLRGEAFILLDSAHERTDVRTMTKLPLTQEQKQYKRWGTLMLQAAEMLETIGDVKPC